MKEKSRLQIVFEQMFPNVVKDEDIPVSQTIAKPNVIRGCDLKGRGAMLALSLILANSGYTGEFILDAEFVKALLKEYTDVAFPTHNLV